MSALFGRSSSEPVQEFRVLHLMKGGTVPDGIQNLLLRFVRRASCRGAVLSLLPKSPIAEQLKAEGISV